MSFWTVDRDIYKNRETQVDFPDFGETFTDVV